MDDEIARIAKFDTPTVSDALDSLGLPGAVYGILPITVARRVVGRAVTVKLGAPIAGLPKRHLGTGAIMAAEKGDIVVVEHRGRLDVSGWGGLLTRAAKAKGLAGVVIDGAFRDIDEARELDFPVFGRAPVPITARGRIAEHSFNEPITFAGICVRPGDIILADGSGIVVVDAARADEVIRTAADIFAREQLMARDIDAGVPVDQVMGANYEDMLKSGSKAR